MFYRIFLFFILVFIGTSFAYIFVSFKNADTLAPNEENFPVPLGLFPIPWPKDNPYSAKKAELGHLLYFDKRLSSDGTISCASCHNRACGFSDCRSIAEGINQTKGTRHSPTIINAAYSFKMFWDGRADTLEEQCKGPLANTKEMTTYENVHDAHRQCVEKVQKIAGYKERFREVFNDDEITLDHIAKAIATFERTVLSGNSPYDRYRAGDKKALTEEQLHGFKLFKSTGCALCHAGFNFVDETFRNIGVGMDKENPDLGRYHITQDPNDWGAFKVPTLREVEHNAPYMHDGSQHTLEEVIEYYDKGGIPNKNLHHLVKPLHLTDEDKKALVAFLKSLSGEGWQHFQEPASFPE